MIKNKINELREDAEYLEQIVTGKEEASADSMLFGIGQRDFGLAENLQTIQHERKIDKHLMAFRGRHPFIEVMPFPHAVRTYYAQNANAQLDVQIPTNAEIMLISAPEGVYFYLGMNKIGSLSTLSSDSVSGPQDFLVSPTKRIFWVKNLTHLYLLIPTMNDAVSFSFWSDI